MVAVPAVPSDQTLTSTTPPEVATTTLLPREADVPTVPIVVVTVTDSSVAALEAFSKAV